MGKRKNKVRVSSLHFAFDTPLGKFKFQASVQTETPDVPKVTLVEREPTQKLPNEMVVKRCRALVLSVSGTTHIRYLTFQCSLEDNALRGEPSTGEGLEAQEWADTKSVVAVGTEDSQRLNNRLPFLHCEDKTIVSYSPDSMTIELCDVPLYQELSLHFIIAENPNPEPVDCSAWFAVDCPHNLLI